MFPEGSYTAMIGAEKWTIRFSKQQFTVSRVAQVVVEGTFKVMADTIEWSDEKGPFASIGERKVGKYRWKVENGVLTFMRMDDKSDGRAEVLTGQPWMLAK